MLKFNDETKTITIVSKDTGDFVLAVDNYLLDTGDVVYFTVNDKIEDSPALISKMITTFTDNKALIRLTSNDTNLTPGTYYYDVEVNTADGRVDTILGPAKFKVIGGVRK